MIMQPTVFLSILFFGEKFRESHNWQGRFPRNIRPTQLSMLTGEERYVVGLSTEGGDIIPER